MAQFILALAGTLSQPANGQAVFELTDSNLFEELSLGMLEQFTGTRTYLNKMVGDTEAEFLVVGEIEQIVEVVCLLRHNCMAVSLDDSIVQGIYNEVSHGVRQYNSGNEENTLHHQLDGELIYR